MCLFFHMILRPIYRQYCLSLPVQKYVALSSQKTKGTKSSLKYWLEGFFSQVSLFKGAGTLFRTVKFSKKQWFVCEVRPAYDRLIKKGKII